MEYGLKVYFRKSEVVIAFQELPRKKIQKFSLFSVSRGVIKDAVKWQILLFGAISVFSICTILLSMKLRMTIIKFISTFRNHYLTVSKSNINSLELS